jgi:hypothetical protein
LLLRSLILAFCDDQLLPAASSVGQGHIWQRRFYDFAVFTERKRVEKLRYMHRNPLKRGLVQEPQQWRWSSFRHYYAYDQDGVVLVNEPRKSKLIVSDLAGTMSR